MMGVYMYKTQRRSCLGVKLIRSAVVLEAMLECILPFTYVDWLGTSCH